MKILLLLISAISVPIAKTSAQELYRMQFNGGYFTTPRSATITGESFNRNMVSISGTLSESILHVSTPNTPLPLELLSFSGILRGDTAFVKWQVADETTAIKYILETSPDSKQFSPLISSTPQQSNGNYNHVQSQKERTLFYRLKILKIDGQISYSIIVKLSKITQENVLAIFPNPATSLININVTDEDQFSLYDLAGKNLLSCSTKPGMNLINVNKIPSGIYLLKGEKYKSIHKITIKK